MNGVHVLIISLCLSLLTNQGLAEGTEEREWTNAEGRKIRATLMKCDANHVELAVRSKSHTIAIQDLSSEDQALLEKLRRRAGGLRKQYFGNRNDIRAEDVKIAWIFGRKEEMEKYMSASKYPWHRRIKGTIARIERRISEQETAVIFECGLICVSNDKSLVKSTHKLITEGKKLYSQRNDARGTQKRCLAEEGKLCKIRGHSLGTGTFGVMKGIIVSGCSRLGRD